MIRVFLFAITVLFIMEASAQRAHLEDNKNSEKKSVTLKMMKLGMAHFPVGVRESDSLVMSYNCYKKAKKCDALKAYLELPSALNLKGSAGGGEHPGAQYCKLILRQKVIILEDSSQNQESFCHFKDGSLLSNSSISARMK